MQRFFFRSKIHRATITSVSLEYEGSVSIDTKLLLSADIRPYEQVDVLNINNGNRFTTYAIEAEANSGIVQVNGAAARLCEKSDLIIILSYCILNEKEMLNFKTKVISVDEQNRLIKK
jgi:aspartate 1-decarboxylase